VGTVSGGSDQTPVSDLRRLWAMVSKPDFGHALAESPDEVFVDVETPLCFLTVPSQHLSS